MSDLTQDRLHEVIHYDPVTGKFTWRVSRGSAKAGSESGGVKLFGPARFAYRCMHVDGRDYLAHRLAWFYMTGDWPPELIDHKDRDGLNNKWSNLRSATSGQNRANSRCRSATGFKGVSLVRSTGHYWAQIRLNGKSKYLGYHKTPEAAHAAYVKAARKHFGEFARAG